MQTQTLAIDFGTSNTAAALAWEGGIYRIPIERGAETLPTAVFFPASGAAMRIGASAAEALIAGEEGRYMAAMKRVLGLPLFGETRWIGDRRRSLADIVTAFLAELKERAEAATGMRFSRALSGRPVHFHTRAPEIDVQAETDLRACYLAAGFEEVAFLAEPEAAALACRGKGPDGGVGLVVDIGGGTSDFTLFREEGGGIDVLASHGIRLGGTDFDHSVSMRHAMPLLGLGGELRREMGDGRVPVPVAPYRDLATRDAIPFLYTPETRRMAAGLARLAVEPEKLGRLCELLETELGHELAFAVERGKIEANLSGGQGRIAMDFLEPGLSAPVGPASFAAAVEGHRHALREAAAETAQRAGLLPERIGKVLLVGGSSLMGFVAGEMRGLCPEAAVLQADAFTAVVDGLALAAHEKRGAAS
ncbi:Hsp70 family protein [Mangrovicoccus sp. HB161399]|uniref:Hsp70 family protein n=1 Tax=Mangrovicoccus sp. HB161399 TaxID=2720392 RepID=UPI001556947E|nr:Hsp70 family protein [Mangrovicoccus sp. HB161399]